MSEQLYKKFSVTGVANVETLDSIGLESTDAEPKTIKSILISVSGWAANQIVGYLEREKKLDIYDYVIHTFTASGTNQYPSTNSLLEVFIDLKIPVGQRFQIGITCGATNKNIFGAYRYEIGA